MLGGVPTGRIGICEDDAALRSVLERVTVADVASGQLPDHVKALLESEDAWVSH